MRRAGRGNEAWTGCLGHWVHAVLAEHFGVQLSVGPIGRSSERTARRSGSPGELATCISTRSEARRQPALLAIEPRISSPRRAPSADLGHFGFNPLSPLR